MKYLAIFIFLIGLSVQAQDKVVGLKTINDLFEIQIAPIKSYFQELSRNRMQVIKSGNNYWYNFNTTRTGEPFFRILISREISENKIRETVEYFVDTKFSARLDLIREGPNLEPTSDDDLLAARFPYPGHEEKYILASSILGFEFFVQKTAEGREAILYYSNNSVKYSITEETGPELKRFKFVAYVFGTIVKLQPQIEMVLVTGEWEPRYFLIPSHEPATPKTFQTALEGLLGYPLQFNCFFFSRINTLKWPQFSPSTCRGITISYPVP